MKKILALFILCILSSSVSAEDYFEAGKKEFYSKNYEKAELLFKKALGQNPENYSCRYFLAHTYVYNDEILKAKEEYSRVITFAPNKTLQKLAMQSMYNLNHETQTTKVTEHKIGDNYFNLIKHKGSHVRWAQFPVRVYVAPSDYSTLIKNAFTYWQKVSGGVVSFDFTGNMKNAQITVNLADTLSFTENNFEAGVATIRAKDNVIYGAEIDLLKRDPSNGDLLGTDVIYATALHEIGHALGLQGHSPNKNDIMTAVNYTDAKTVSERDLNTLLMLYQK